MYCKILNFVVKRRIISLIERFGRLNGVNLTGASELEWMCCFNLCWEFYWNIKLTMLKKLKTIFFRTWNGTTFWGGMKLEYQKLIWFGIQMFTSFQYLRINNKKFIKIMNANQIRWSVSPIWSAQNFSHINLNGHV